MLYGGMNVGKVTAVRPWAADPTRIEILLEVKKDTPLNEKSVAKLGFVSVMNSAALSITTGTIDAKRLPPDSTVASQEAASLDEIAGKLATVADSANTLITQAQGELNDISGNMNHLIANLDTMTGPGNQKRSKPFCTTSIDWWQTSAQRLIVLQTSWPGLASMPTRPFRT